MSIFALHIKTGSEYKVQEIIKQFFCSELKVFNPLRELITRKNGITKRELRPLFPGYLFVESDEISAFHLMHFKKIPDFFQVLPSNRGIKPLCTEEINLLKDLFYKNQVATLSKAKFDENDRIVIIDGPLKGKEGQITKVDKRKGRARIAISAFNQIHHIDLGFQIISKS